MTKSISANLRSNKVLFLFFVVLLSTFFVLVFNKNSSASGLEMAPLKYKTNLDGKIKKGAVDIKNSSGFTQNITIQVKAFEQINSKGELRFYEKPSITSGITPDYETITLKPYESIHLFFVLDGKKLPKSSIFAAILAEAEPSKSSYNITPVVRVGTLLMLNNGPGGTKKGKISNWNVRFLQFGKSITGSFDFENIEHVKNNGFFPKFSAKLGSTKKNFSGNLVFPGIKRKQNFSITTDKIGIYKLQLKDDAGSSAQQWMIVVTGFWRWLAPSIVFVVLAISTFGLLKYRKDNNKSKYKKTSRKIS